MSCEGGLAGKADAFGQTTDLTDYPQKVVPCDAAVSACRAAILSWLLGQDANWVGEEARG